MRIAPVHVSFGDGQLAHFAGLNINCAWMLAAIHSALPTDDPRRPLLLDLTQRPQSIGLVDALQLHGLALGAEFCGLSAFATQVM